MIPEVVFFDMDYTILKNDCDVLWKNFLADMKVAPESARERANYYLDLHHKGELPVAEYIDFQWKEFAGNTPDIMQLLSQKHYEEYVQKYIYPDAVKEIEKYREQDIPIVIITGTNRIIATPISVALRAELIASDLEIKNGKFTGKIDGPFMIKENKLKLAQEYCQKRQTSFDKVVFYADSINDAELLDMVGQAIVVNPHDKLLELAHAKNWRIVSWSL
ncbi:HAD-IB family hydrolase [candidate division KSB1 bacterium]|nr:HAD-IB family hydrolase [candidate division KSB1 bacterium]